MLIIEFADDFGDTFGNYAGSLIIIVTNNLGKRRGPEGFENVAAVRRFDGTTWVNSTLVKRFNGTAWVDVTNS